MTTTKNNAAEQTAINRAGSAHLLDRLATIAGPSGVVAVTDDGAIAVGAPASESSDPQRLAAALRQLVVNLGNDSPRALSTSTALAYQYAVRVLAEHDGAAYHSAEHAANEAARNRDAFGGKVGQ